MVKKIAHSEADWIWNRKVLFAEFKRNFSKTREPVQIMVGMAEAVDQGLPANHSIDGFANHPPVVGSDAFMGAKIFA